MIKNKQGKPMKVKWTTITEDESTWPLIGVDFCISYGDTSLQSHRYKDSNDKDFIITGLYRDIRPWPHEHIGKQWRPMPRPLKKAFDGKCSKCSIESKSSWKSCSILPEETKTQAINRTVMIQHKSVELGNCYLAFGCYQPTEKSWVIFDHGCLNYKACNPVKWMEIPE